jgi:hypothetical protein
MIFSEKNIGQDTFAQPKGDRLGALRAPFTERRTYWDCIFKIPERQTSEMYSTCNNWAIDDMFFFDKAKGTPNNV